MGDFRDALLGAAGTDEDPTGEPSGPRPPDNGWLLVVAFKDTVIDGPHGRQWKQVPIPVLSYDVDHPSVLIFWDENGAEHGLPWSRVASYEAIPSEARKAAMMKRSTAGAGVEVDIEDRTIEDPGS